MNNESCVATVSKGQLRILYEKSGSLRNSFSVGNNATHAIVQDDNSVAVFYNKGGVKVFSFGGSCQSVNGDCF